jgi:hypothetical protein
MQQHSKLDIVDEKYQRTIIYGIICLITGEIYVGSTVLTLKERIRLHIQQRNCSAIQILDRGSYKVYEIQRWPCNTLREVRTLEGGWQRAYKASFPEHFVNKQIEGHFSTDSPEALRAYGKQYREEHKEEKRASNKKYHQEHKEENNARSRKYKEEHKDETQAYNKQYREGHKEEIQAYGKQYHEEHKEENNARSKQYKEEHKEETQAYNKQYRKKPWTCEYCNKKMTTGSRARHKRVSCKSKPIHT